MASIRKGRGQPKTFNDSQNAALRGALLDLKQRKKLSQAALGELLSIGQQSVGRLERVDGAGFSHATATALVRALGYASVDTFFRTKQVAA